MVIAHMKTTTVQKQFVIEASHERVWDLVANVILQCLPLEKIDIISESAFNAVLRWKLGFVSLPMNLKGELVDISPPTSLTCMLRVEVAIMRLAVKVRIVLAPVSQGKKTEVVCTAQDAGTIAILRWVMGRQQQRFAGNTFDSIKKRLEQLC
ncbi:SRPBCC domain-containing protein [Chloroflexota bacterium]